MPDEPKTETPVLEIDIEDLATKLQPAMGEMVKNAVTEANQAAEAQRRQAAQRQSVKPDALAETLAPYLGPVAQHANLVSAAAADYAKFYTDHPEAKKHQGALEKKFGELMASGQPLVREDIWSWFRGQNFEQFAKEYNEEQSANANRAQQEGMTVIGGSRGPVMVTQDPWQMTPEDLDKAMAGKSF